MQICPFPLDESFKQRIKHAIARHGVTQDEVQLDLTNDGYDLNNRRHLVAVFIWPHRELVLDQDGQEIAWHHYGVPGTSGLHSNASPDALPNLA